MQVKIRKQRTQLRMLTGVDAKGNRYDLQEWREMVSVQELAGWSAWEPFNGHGQVMTCNGVELERISSTLWEMGQPPVELTVLE